MEIRHGNKMLVALIDDTIIAIEELTAWPDSKITQRAADKAVRLLKKGWKEENYPRAFLYFAMLHIAHNVRGRTCNRESVKEAGLRAAWMKIGELL
jgi:hypothetical protein